MTTAPRLKFLDRHGWLQGLLIVRVVSIIIVLSKSQNTTTFNMFLESWLSAIHLGAWVLFVGRLLIGWIVVRFPITSMLWQARLQIILSALVASTHSLSLMAWRCISSLCSRRVLPVVATEDFNVQKTLLVTNCNDKFRKGISESMETIHTSFRPCIQDHKFTLGRMWSSYAHPTQEPFPSPGSLLVEMHRLDGDAFHLNHQHVPYDPFTSFKPSSLTAPSRNFVDRGDTNFHNEEVIVVESTSRDKNQ